jgi:hypothetical protein
MPPSCQADRRADRRPRWKDREIGGHPPIPSTGRPPLTTSRHPPPSAADPRLAAEVPHNARIWNYWLGGTDNFPADRAVAEAAMRAYPEIVTVARESRKALARIVRFLAGPPRLGRGRHPRRARPLVGPRPHRR